MGLDDMVNKAKDLLGGAQDKADQATASAAAGDAQAAAAQAQESSGLVGKAKALPSDERIDSITGAIKDKTPDNIDAMVDKAATKAKSWNN